MLRMCCHLGQMIEFLVFSTLHIETSSPRLTFANSANVRKYLWEKTPFSCTTPLDYLSISSWMRAATPVFILTMRALRSPCWNNGNEHAAHGRGTLNRPLRLSTYNSPRQILEAMLQRRWFRARCEVSSSWMHRQSVNYFLEKKVRLF